MLVSAGKVIYIWYAAKAAVECSNIFMDVLNKDGWMDGWMILTKMRRKKGQSCKLLSK